MNSWHRHRPRPSQIPLQIGNHYLVLAALIVVVLIRNLLAPSDLTVIMGSVGWLLSAHSRVVPNVGHQL